MKALTKINQFLPSITLLFLLVAIYQQGGSQQLTIALMQQQQRLGVLVVEQEKSTYLLQQELVQVDSNQDAQAVRLTRIESDLCRRQIAHNVQCD